MKKFLLLLLIALNLFSIPVSAVPSPTPVEYYSITVGMQWQGYVEVDKTSVEINNDETVIFTAKEGKKHFLRWEITGTYEIISGNLSNLILQIEPKSDIVAIGIFEDGEKLSPVLSEPEPFSPKTGQKDTLLFVSLGLIVISTIIIMICKKNSKK